MRGRLVTITPGALIKEVPLDRAPNIDMLQAAIGGGSIETVPYFGIYDGQECVAFVDEEGKLKGFPLNHTATALWNAQVQGGLRGRDYLVGPVAIVCGDHDLLGAL